MTTVAFIPAALLLFSTAASAADTLPAAAPPGALTEEGSSLAPPQLHGSASSSHPTAVEPPRAKSSATALYWSLFGTFVPALLSAPQVGDGQGPAIVFLGAVVIGPSLGHFYAARPGRAVGGITLRAAALTGVVAGVAMAWNSESTHGGPLAVAGLAIGATSLIVDIASAPGSARLHNQRAEQGRLVLGVTPPCSSRGPGLCANVSF